MGNYPAYPAYKASGVEWLGEIPAHWPINRLRFVLTTNPSKSEIRLSEDEPVSFVPMEAVGEYGGLNLDIEKPLEEVGSGYTYFANRDVIVAKITPCFENGKGALAKELVNGVGFGTTELHVLRAHDELNEGFLFYLTISQVFRKLGEAEMYGAGGQKRVPENFIRDLRLGIPPLPEQEAIACFLDRKTAQIDGLIAKKEALLARLADKRTALISHAVTKGLDPDAPMKDSGVPWLGEIPGHWERVKVKFLIDKIVDTEHKTAPFHEDGEYLVVRTSNVRDGKLVLENARFTDRNGFLEWTRRAVPKPGDIIFTREAPAGEACVVPEGLPLCLGQRTVLFQVNRTRVDSKFLVYSIYSGLASEFVRTLSQGSTVDHFNMSDIGNIPLFEVPFREQQRISEYLTKKLADFDLMAAKIQAAIDKLKAYRTALITYAVTGKIDVRGA